MPRDRGVAELAMLLSALAGGEYPRRYRPSAHQFTHRPVHPADIEKVILLALGEKDVLFDVVQDPIQRGLGDGGERAA